MYMYTKPKIVHTVTPLKKDKVVLEPLVSPDLAIYSFKQVKVKMTLDLVMSP